MRYLHFGTEWIQGGMRVSRPYALELAYQQEMMAPGLFLPEPRRIVQLGLGAAALTKFCYRNVPSADVLVVELSQEVIDAARGWFLLPDDDARLTVVHDDAKDFIAHPKQRGRADWLQVDLYDKHARGPVYDDVEFYRICRAALSRPGVACFNLFGRRFDPSFERICAAFDDRALALPEVDEGNRIVARLQRSPALRPDGRPARACRRTRGPLETAGASLGLRPALGERPGGRSFRSDPSRKVATREFGTT